MKKYLIIIFTLLGTLPGIAQVLDFEKFYDKYTGQEGYTTMHFTAPLLRMMTGDTGGAFDKINTIKSVITNNPGKGFDSDTRALFRQDGFTKLFNVKSNTEGFEIWHKEKGKGLDRDKIEYILYVNKENETILLYVEGEVDLLNLRQLSTINFGGE